MERDINSGVARIAELYFAPKKLEQEGTIYESIGVEKLKRYIPTGGDIVLRQLRKHGKSGLISGIKDLRSYERTTRICEAGHLVSGAVCTGLAIDSAIDNRWDMFAINVSTNLVLNAFPILVQRYNRARLYRAIERAENRKPETSLINFRELDDVA